MQDYLDNPAGRMLVLLRTAQQAASHAEPAMRAWAKAFEIQEQDMGSMLSQGARLIRLAATIRIKVERFEEEEDAELRLTHFSQIENVLKRFGQIATISHSGFFEGFESATAQHSLQLCSALLHRKSRDVEISSERIADLKYQVEDLIQSSTGNPDLSPRLKGWLLARLADILDTINNYDKFGPSDIEDSSDRLIGSIRRNPDHLVELSKHPKLLEKMKGFVIAIDLALNIAANASQLTSGGASPQPDPKPQIVEIFQSNLSGPDIGPFSVLELPPGPSRNENPSK